MRIDWHDSSYVLPSFLRVEERKWQVWCKSCWHLHVLNAVVYHLWTFHETCIGSSVHWEQVGLAAHEMWSHLSGISGCLRAKVARYVADYCFRKKVVGELIDELTCQFFLNHVYFKINDGNRHCRWWNFHSSFYILSRDAKAIFKNIYTFSLGGK